jgi:hypothetical protein
MKKSRIPDSPAQFDVYIVSVDNHLSATEQGGTMKRGEILGMSAVEIAKTNDFATKWRSGDLMNPGYYELHCNPDVKSKGTRANVMQLIKDFKVFFRPILLRISGSPNITPDDRLILHIAEPVTVHSRPTARIEDPVIVSIEAFGNGSIQIGVRPRDDTSRFSLPKGANAVEIAYAICEGKFKAGAELIGKVKSSFQGPDDGSIRLIRTTARMYIDLDTIFIGYELRFYIRWINVHYPELASPWSGPYSAMIS